MFLLGGGLVSVHNVSVHSHVGTRTFIYICIAEWLLKVVKLGHRSVAERKRKDS